ncbi:MAG: FAD-dependent oxidoreductase, partial [Alphaproteobacteria bacterium]|nr:FAD-dependent oxidoreductase [Alphaproteobacteria bacterium]
MSQCLVLGAGIVGVSTAIWLQRSGHEVVLIDREGPAAGASHGNAGMLASASLVPVTTPGLWKKVPKMLFDPDGPLFVRWSGALRMVPFLTRYLQHCRTSHVQYYAEKMGPLIYDSLAQHRALAQDTIAMEYIKEADYCFGYDHEYQWAQDQKGWDLRQQAGIRFETLSGQEYEAHDPIFSGCFAKVVRCVDHGMITDPPAYVRALAEHFVEQGGTLLIKDVTEVDIKTGPRPLVKTKDEDFVQHLFVASTHSYLMFLTSKGKCYWLKVYRIPEGERAARGRPLVNLLQIDQDDQICAIVSLREFSDDHYLFTATRRGIVKKTVLSAYQNIRRDGIIALKIHEDDDLIGAAIIEEDQDITLITRSGRSMRFNEEEVRPMGRVSTGVKGIGLREDDEVVDMVVVSSPDSQLMT